ncbi:hypothetical protein ABVT39_028042, partial [Epinephelus coioides]
NGAGARGWWSGADFMDRMHAGPHHPEGGRSTLPAHLQPLSPAAAAAAAALEGTPVTLSQGCGGGEGTNTLEQKEQAHTHNIHTEKAATLPPTLRTL